MTRRPWYKRDGAAFIAGTMGLTLEEKGAYSLCLDLIYSNGGPIPDDARWLAGVCGVSLRKWAALRARLLEVGKLTLEGGMLMNPRAVREIADLDGPKASETPSKSDRNLSETSVKPQRKVAEKDTTLNKNNGLLGGDKSREREDRDKNKKEDSCAAPSALAPVAPPIITIPTNRSGEEYPVSQAQLDEFEAAYPAVDVRQQLRQMRAWAFSNPSKRKTARGMAKFINAWLGKEQDRGGSFGRRPGGNSAPTRADNAFGGAFDALASLEREQDQAPRGGTGNASGAQSAGRGRGETEARHGDGRADHAAAPRVGSVVSIAAARSPAAEPEVPDFLRGLEAPHRGGNGRGMPALSAEPEQQVLSDAGADTSGAARGVLIG